MSPVSKSRKNKKRGVRDTDDQWVDAEPEIAREPPSWFAPSIDAVLGHTDDLCRTTGPRELEQAVCELLGEQLYRTVHGDPDGLWFYWWFEQLVVAAAARVRESDDLTGDWWLLHGMAAVGSPALRSMARHQVNGLLKAARRRPAYARQPRWLASTHLVRATGRVWRMRDAYGTRIAVLAAMSHPHGVDPSVFLFDIDACEVTRLAGAGSYADLAQAAAAWRAQVGDTATDVEAVEVTTGEQLSCLAHTDVGGNMVMGDETRQLLDNWFLAQRCVHDLAHALRKSPLLWPRSVSLFDDLPVEPMAQEFARWYADQHGTAPEPEIAEALALEWLEAALPETRYSISPHRVANRRSLIADTWIPDHPDTAAVQALIGDWVRWLGQKSGLPTALIDRAVDAEPSPD